MGETLDTAAQLATLFSAALTAIKDIIASITVNTQTAEVEALKTALTSINAVLATIPNLAGATPAQIDKAQADLDRLTQALAGHDAKADAALDKKFDLGDNRDK